MIDFYTWAAPNGRRVAIMLEECGLPHRTLPVDLGRGDHHAPGFRALNPSGAIPVIVDHDRDGGPLTLTQSAAILQYLARKCGRLLPDDAAAQARVLEALMLVMTDVAAAAVSGFLMARLAEPPAEAAAVFRTRLQNFLDVVEGRVTAADFLAGDYSIADVALYPISRLPIVEAAIDTPGRYDRFLAWRERVGSRPAVVAGMASPQTATA